MSVDNLFQTPLCRRLGIRYPIFRAGMGYVAHAELAAAVPNAGGMGCIGSGSMGSRELREQIRRCRSLTDRPFAVDVLLADAVEAPVPAAGGIADGRDLLAAMMLGAQGVWVGARFVASVEAYAHFNFKNRILEIDEEGTTISRCHSGKPCRLIRNQSTESWAGREGENFALSATVRPGPDSKRPKSRAMKEKSRKAVWPAAGALE